MRVLVDGRLLLAPGRRVRFLHSDPACPIFGTVSQVSIAARGRTVYMVALWDDDNVRREIDGVEEHELEPADAAAQVD